MGLNESLEKKPLLEALKNLEKKSKSNIENITLAYETGDKKEQNIIYAQMTRTPKIEKKSIDFINNLMKDTLKNSRNSKIKVIFKKLNQLV